MVNNNILMSGCSEQATDYDNDMNLAFDINAYICK